MKVSVKWMQWYTKIDWPTTDVLVRKIGDQLGAVEEVTDLGAKYQGILVAKVVECVKLEDSDHLNLCKIDDGGKAQNVERDANGYVQVVCGAPNVRAGILVAWLPPGSTVPSSFDTDPFVLEARELRGAVSNGMLASPKELAIGDSHDGILELDGQVKPGDDFAEAYPLNDQIIDIENKMFTHRPDCFGQMGVAREIAGITGQLFTSPDWYDANMTIEFSGEHTLKVEVKNEIPELVPRFAVLPMSNVTVKPSPVWLQTYLQRVGIRPINNVVDLTNYYMILTGQPLHAYDYDKVVAQDAGASHATLTVRLPHDGEKLKLLNGKEIEPRKEAILIASATQPVGLGGVMGGADTEVDANTKNIILECANFDMYSIRRTSMAHGLFSEAVTRFNKGQSPLQNIAVLAKIADDMIQIVGAAVAGDCVDDNHLSADVVQSHSLYPAVSITPGFINDRLGLKLTSEQIEVLLKNVEFTVENQGEKLTVKAPFWRTDIEIPEDIVEEVGRLFGFDHVPLALPERSIKPVTKNDLFELKARLRRTLARAGANEVLTYSFVHGNLLDSAGQNKEVAYKLSNALSPDLQYFRTSLLPSLLDKVHANIKAGYDEFALFELGKIHATTLTYEGHPVELERLSFVFTANDKAAKQHQGAPYYQAKAYVDMLLHELGIDNEVTFLPLDPPAYVGGTAEKITFFEPGRTAMMIIDKVNIGEVGEFKAKVRSGLKLPAYTAGFDLDVGALLAYANRQKPYAQLPRFPKVTQDITLKVPSGVTYKTLYDFVLAKATEVQPDHSSLKIEPLGIYQKTDDLGSKQVTLRISIANYQKTLTDAEVNNMLDQVAAAGAEQLKSERV